MEEKDDYNKFLKYMAKGWMRPDKLPFQLKSDSDSTRKKWFAFFKSISYGQSEVGNYKVAAGLYKNYYFLEQYYINSLKLIKE